MTDAARIEDFNHHAYHRILDNDAVLCELEELRRHGDAAVMFMIHARFKAPMSPRLFKDCLLRWNHFRTVFTQPIFASPQVYNDRWIKFVKSFGFVPLIDAAPCNDGEMRPIWINYGQLQPNQQHAEPEPDLL